MKRIRWWAVTAVVLASIAGLTLNSAARKGDEGKADPVKKVRAELSIGGVAPLAKQKMADVSGKDMSLADVKGQKGLLVIFSCNSCPFVIAWEDRYLTIAELCKKEGIGMIAVNSNEGHRTGADSLSEMKKHAEEKGYSFPYVVDKNSELADAFGATRTPHIFLFDKNLKLAYRGAIDDNSRDASAVKDPYLARAISAVSAGEKIATKTSKSIGCSIKRA